MKIVNSLLLTCDCYSKNYRRIGFVNTIYHSDLIRVAFSIGLFNKTESQIVSDYFAIFEVISHHSVVSCHESINLIFRINLVYSLKSIPVKPHQEFLCSLMVIYQFPFEIVKSPDWYLKLFHDYELCSFFLHWKRMLFCVTNNFFLLKGFAHFKRMAMNIIKCNNLVSLIYFIPFKCYFWITTFNSTFNDEIFFDLLPFSDRREFFFP